MSRTDAPGSSDSACPRKASRSRRLQKAPHRRYADLLPPAGEVVAVARQARVELATTEAAWARASGSRPRASIRSMAPCRWGFTLSRSGQAVEGLADTEETTGMT